MLKKWNILWSIRCFQQIYCQVLRNLWKVGIHWLNHYCYVGKMDNRFKLVWQWWFKRWLQQMQLEFFSLETQSTEIHQKLSSQLTLDSERYLTEKIDNMEIWVDLFFSSHALFFLVSSLPSPSSWAPTTTAASTSPYGGN